MKDMMISVDQPRHTLPSSPSPQLTAKVLAYDAVLAPRGAVRVLDADEPRGEVGGAGAPLAAELDLAHVGGVEAEGGAVAPAEVGVAAAVAASAAAAEEAQPRLSQGGTSCDWKKTNGNWVYDLPIINTTTGNYKC